MAAIESELTFIKSACPPGFYQSLWDKLCEALAEATPAGMNAEENIPNVDIWRDSVVLESDTNPYSFTVTTDDDDAPVAGDVIEYKGRFFIIGSVA